MSSITKWKKGIVIGAGISGLLTANVLSQYFQRVELYDKDKINTNSQMSETRNGVPQGEHVHVVLTAAVKSLSKRFPELFSKLEDAGSTRYQVNQDVKWHHHGCWKKQFQTETDFTSYAQSRPLLERLIREEVLQSKNVDIIGQSKLSDFIYDNENNMIKGIKIRRRDQEEEIFADLVVDATGRSTKALRYLKQLGLEKPEVQTVDVDIKYVSTYYPDENNIVTDNSIQAVYPAPPDTSKFGIIGDVEGDKVIVTLIGIGGDHPTTDREEFLEFARQLDQPHIYEKLRDLEPLSPLRSHAYPRMRRIHYHSMPDLPSNFLAVGDALCHFDPIFGQGMTVATLEADMLEEVLDNTGKENLSKVNRRFFKKANGLISVVWDLVVAEDTRYDFNEDPSFMQRMYQKLSNEIYQLSDDKYVLERFYKVIHLEESPTHLLHPKVLLKILKKKIFG